MALQDRLHGFSSHLKQGGGWVDGPATFLRWAEYTQKKVSKLTNWHISVISGVDL